MGQTANEAIAEYYNASETIGAHGAHGRELGETGFSARFGYGSGSYSITEVAEWAALSAAEAEIYAVHTFTMCECCGPLLTREGEEEMARVRAELLPRWYLRRR